MKVKLQDVVEEMDVLHDQAAAYLNKRTGELMTLTTEEFRAAERWEAEKELEEVEDVLADYPEWQHELILKAKEIMESEDWLGLPSKFDIHEYAIMEEFCRSIADDELSYRLLSTIRGSGAFGRFRGAIEALDLEQAWYDFRAGELEKIAVEWLEVNEIEYTSD